MRRFDRDLWPEEREADAGVRAMVGVVVTTAVLLLATIVVVASGVTIV